MLARIRAEEGFFKAVVAERGPWLARLADVKHAVLQNALDAKRPDQREWMERFATMLDVDLFGGE